jgi:hypothetical protein
VTDRPSNSGGSTEPPRGRSIPADFIWDEERQCWDPPGEPSTFDVEGWLRNFEELCKELGPTGLISREELLAAGALVTPDKKSKTLSVKRDLFSGLFSEADLEGDEPADADQAETDDPMDE